MAFRVEIPHLDHLPCADVLSPSPLLHTGASVQGALLPPGDRPPRPDQRAQGRCWRCCSYRPPLSDNAGNDPEGLDLVLEISLLVGGQRKVLEPHPRDPKALLKSLFPANYLLDGGGAALEARARASSLSNCCFGLDAEAD